MSLSSSKTKKYGGELECATLDDPARVWLKCALCLFITVPLVWFLVKGVDVIFFFYVAVSILNILVIFSLLKFLGSRRVLFLRAFGQDSGSDPLKQFLRGVLPKGYHLSGIRPPRKRDSYWLRVIGFPLTALKYIGSNIHELEASDKNWLPRLGATLCKSNGVVIDLRSLTPMVHHEISLALKSCVQKGSLYLITDNSKDMNQWVEVLQTANGGETIDLNVISWIHIEHDQVLKSSEYIAAHIQQFKQLPKNDIPCNANAKTFIESVVKKGDWKASILENSLFYALVYLLVINLIIYFLPHPLTFILVCGLFLFYMFFLGVALLRTRKVLHTRRKFKNISSSESAWFRSSVISYLFTLFLPFGLLWMGMQTVKNIERKKAGKVIAVCEAEFDNARQNAISKGEILRIIILENDGALEYGIVSNVPSDADDWRIDEGSLLKIEGVSFNSELSQNERLGEVWINGAKVACYYYEFNDQGALTGSQDASFIIQSGDHSADTETSDRDLHGFMIWKNGRISSLRTKEQILGQGK